MSSPRKSPPTQFRKADLDNLPLQIARRRFLDKLAEHSQILQRLPFEAYMSLSDEARQLCEDFGWQEISTSPTWSDLDLCTATEANRQQQRIHFEMIPLCRALNDLASEFGLLHHGKPSIWAMDTVVRTLGRAAKRPPEKRTERWYHCMELSQGYPAMTESGYTSLRTGLPEEELFEILIRIPPKQPTESIRAFEIRFNRECRAARIAYLEHLKAEKWRAWSPDLALVWIERLAQWQTGLRTTQIDPSTTTSSRRITFRNSLKRAADYIQITPTEHRPGRPAKR